MYDPFENPKDKANKHVMLDPVQLEIIERTRPGLLLTVLQRSPVFRYLYKDRKKFEKNPRSKRNMQLEFFVYLLGFSAIVIYLMVIF